MAVYLTVVMDGCRDLLSDARANGKRTQGDLCHVGKNWMKWARLCVPALCRRPPKDASEKVPNPRVEPVKLAPERLEAYGDRPPRDRGDRVGSAACGGAQGEVGGCWACVRCGCGTAGPQRAWAEAAILTAELASALAMNAAERQQQRKHEAYIRQSYGPCSGG